MHKFIVYYGILFWTEKVKEVSGINREEYMKMAIALALEAAKDGDVPVGCVIADGGGKIIGRGRNRREMRKNALCHAEIEAIFDACRSIGDWRLDNCTMYVTLEPCPMCAGAIINARIPRLVYGAREPRSGSCGSVINLFMENYGFSPQIEGGVLEDECREMLRVFFEKLR